MMNREQKTKQAELYKEKFTKSSVALFADYRGLKAADANELRKRMRTKETELHVIKNSVIRRAIEAGALGDDAKNLTEKLAGPTLVGFVMGDPAAAAKEFVEYSKENEALELKDSLMGKQKITQAELQQLADLPSKEVMIATLLSVMNGPVRNFVGVLAAVPRGFVQVLQAIADKKGS